MDSGTRRELGAMMGERAGRVARPLAVGRVVGFDRLRGLGVLAMLVDHVVAVVGGPAFLRLTVGRVAMPVFALVVGALSARALSPRRLREWLAVCALAYPLYDYLGLPGWEMLLLLLVGRSVGPRPALGAVCIVLGLTLGANGWAWPGHYVPVSVIGLCVMGYRARGYLAVVGERLPGWCGGIGRRPLAWYVGHLGALAALVAVGGV